MPGQRPGRSASTALVRFSMSSSWRRTMLTALACPAMDGLMLKGGYVMRHRIAALAGAGVMMAALGTAVPAAAGTAPGRAVPAATACGSWRWPVKTGSDATRGQVSRSISYTSVGYLDHLTPPASFGSYA